MIELKITMLNGQIKYFYESSQQEIDARIQSEVIDHPEIYPNGTTYLVTEINEQEKQAKDQKTINQAKADLAESLGREVWKSAWLLIKAKGVSDAGADALISDANLSAIERFTKGGFFLDAKRKVQSLDTSLFSSEEKLALIALLEAADAKLA